LGLVVLAGGALGFMALSRKAGRVRHGPQDAPLRALRHHKSGSSHIVGRTVTIARPRDQVYRAWRDFTQFPSFMENVRSVDILDAARSRWTVEGPAGSTIQFLSRIVEDRPGEYIAWRSDNEAAVANSGEVSFRDAPGGRGTEVDLTISYEPPGGAIGAVVAKMFQREPNIQARRDLKRFKQLMETGEVATSQMRPSSGGQEQ
jgi:uncharacterized membrane protein